MGTRLDALDLAIANVQSSIPDVSAFVTSLQVRALIDTSLSDYYNKQAIDGKLADYYTKTEIGNNFFTKQQTTNLLNTTLQNYYNKTETIAKIDSRLTSYYTKSQVYSKTETDAKLTDYYTKTETYSKTEVDNLIPESIDLSLYAKKNDANQTIRTGIVSCVTYQNPNGKSVIYIADASAYTTRPFLATDATHSGTMTYAYMSGNRSGYAYFGLWRDDYYPHLTLTKTLTTFNKPGVFNDVITFNNDVTFNDVVTLTSTITLDTKVIETVVRSNDDITPSDTNIPSTLWAQNKFNTKVDNGTVYTKVELNDLLQLTNLSSIVLTCDQPYNSPLFLFSATLASSQKLYWNYQKTQNFSSNKKIFVLSRPYSLSSTITISTNNAYISTFSYYTFLPDNLNFKAIKITQENRETEFCFNETTFVLGTPIKFPWIDSFTPDYNLLSLQLSFTYTIDGSSESDTRIYSTLDIRTPILYMSGENILNPNHNKGGFYFICYGKTFDQNTNTFQTTVRWLFLGQQQSYSFTSDNGTVFYVPFNAETYHIWYGQFQFKAENINAPEFYDHSFEKNISSAQRISGGPDLDTFIIEIGDFPMTCGMFYMYLTNLN